MSIREQHRSNFSKHKSRVLSKVVYKLTDGKKYSLPKHFRPPKICQLLCWRDVCGVSRQDSFVSIPGWCTVPQRMTHFASPAHCSAETGPPKVNLSRTFLSPGWQKTSEKCAENQSPRSHQDSLFEQTSFSCRLSIKKKTSPPSRTCSSLIKLSKASVYCSALRILYSVVADNVLRYAGIRKS